MIAQGKDEYLGIDTGGYRTWMTRIHMNKIMMSFINSFHKVIGCSCVIYITVIRYWPESKQRRTGFIQLTLPCHHPSLGGSHGSNSSRENSAWQELEAETPETYCSLAYTLSHF